MADDMERGDEPPFPAMAPEGVEELTEEQQDRQNGLKQQAADAAEDGKLDVALDKLTEAIAVGCASAMLYSRRAQLLLQLSRPRAADRDCTAALAVNPDSAKAFKCRARARAKLERWEAAHADFQTALRIDYDEQTDEDSRQAAEKAKALQAAATAKRVDEERAEQQRQNLANKEAYEAGVKARQQTTQGEQVGQLVLNSEADYEKAIAGDRPVVILFSATW